MFQHDSPSGTCHGQLMVLGRSACIARGVGEGAWTHRDPLGHRHGVKVGRVGGVGDGRDHGKQIALGVGRVDPNGAVGEGERLARADVGEATAELGVSRESGGECGAVGERRPTSVAVSSLKPREVCRVSGVVQERRGAGRVTHGVVDGKVGGSGGGEEGRGSKESLGGNHGGRRRYGAGGQRTDWEETGERCRGCDVA